VHSAWDIISADLKPGRNVLIYDDAGDHAGLQAAEIIAASGARVEIMTRDRSFAPEVMDTLVATIGSDYGGVSKEQRHDQIIVAPMTSCTTRSNRYRATWAQSITAN